MIVCFKNVSIKYSIKLFGIHKSLTTITKSTKSNKKTSQYKKEKKNKKKQVGIRFKK